MIEINKTEEFATILSSNPNILVIVEFTASWCSACRRMESELHDLAENSSHRFYRVDVDDLTDIALGENVSVLPTFIIYKDGKKVGFSTGADIDSLKNKINEFDTTLFEPKDCNSLKDKLVESGMECLNECDEFPLKNLMIDDEKCLKSDCDEQLIIAVEFDSPVRLHSLIIKAPEDTGPKDIKLFKNQPKTLSFDEAESNVSQLELSLSSEYLNGKPVTLKATDFQNVRNLQIFVKTNQTGAEKTCLNFIDFLGISISEANLKNLKKKN